jgi:glycosyltransferase involved in cell wall biosynthesis
VLEAMNILFIHNAYKQFGGEDTVLQAETDLLTHNNHHCSLASQQNSQVRHLIDKINAIKHVAYSYGSKQWVLKHINYHTPDIVHVHNFFPLLTPSVYDACIDAGIPVVQTLHNYRTICPGALLMRNGKICEKCITGSPYQAILHRCYRNSIPGSWAVARMVAYHRKKKTWQHKVDRFIALTRFGKQKFIEAGFPAEKITVKPNFCEVKKQSAEDKGLRTERRGALFVGRLSEEKGVATMLEAWRGLDIPLRIAGGGPLLAGHGGEQEGCIAFLGQVTGEQVAAEMTQASFLVMPSEWYEGFPMVLVECFAHGLPVVASQLGGMAEIVEDGITGLHFEPGNPADLAQKVQWMHDHPEECRQMGKNARRMYDEKYTPEKNYEMLMDVYKQAISSKERISRLIK